MTTQLPDFRGRREPILITHRNVFRAVEVPAKADVFLAANGIER